MKRHSDHDDGSVLGGQQELVLQPVQVELIGTSIQNLPDFLLAWNAQAFKQVLTLLRSAMTQSGHGNGGVEDIGHRLIQGSVLHMKRKIYGVS